VEEASQNTYIIMNFELYEDYEEIQFAYEDWTEFIDKMNSTNLSWVMKQYRRDGVDWNDLGRPDFTGLGYAGAIWCNRNTLNTVAREIYDRFPKCIDALMYIESFGLELPRRDFTGQIYNLVKTYPYIQTAKQHTLPELRELVRLNHVPAVCIPQTRCKMVWVIALQMSRPWGFNTFAIKSQMNDDVLAKIKSFV
jgi:hypothetical protein